jgi:hypothetical protein
MPDVAPPASETTSPGDARTRVQRLLDRIPPPPLGFLAVVCLLLGIGLSAAESALTPDRTSRLALPFSGLWSAVTPTHAVTVLGAIAAVLVWRRSRSTTARVAVAVLAASLSVAVSGVNLDSTFAPPGTFGQQFEANYAHSGNLTYGAQLAANLREGHGFRYDNGSVETYRMPGYPALVAVAGAITGTPERDLRSVTRITIWTQLLLTAFAIGLFVFMAGPRLRRPVVLALALLLPLLPADVELTQEDSVILAAGLIAAAALLPFLDRARGDRARWRDVVLLHGAFAFWYLMRTDVAIAWAIVSLIVHGRRWRHLLVWLTLFVGINTGFGAYTATHGNEFTFGTNNLGHVAFIGLWQEPQDRFQWQPSDASYDQWISANGYTYRRPGANGFAERQIARFYLTYPGYVTTMAVDKTFGYFDKQAWSSSTPFSIGRRLATAHWVSWLLFSAIVLALATGYRRRKTALLGWGVLFVLPIFLFVQSEPRFTLFVTASLLVGGLSVLSRRGFYRTLLRRWQLALPLAAVLLCIWLWHGRIDSALLGWDGFRYWAPFLDPSGSTLVVPH